SLMKSFLKSLVKAKPCTCGSKSVKRRSAATGNTARPSSSTDRARTKCLFICLSPMWPRPGAAAVPSQRQRIHRHGVGHLPRQQRTPRDTGDEAGLDGIEHGLADPLAAGNPEDRHALMEAREGVEKFALLLLAPLPRLVPVGHPSGDLPVTRRQRRQRAG